MSSKHHLNSRQALCHVSDICETLQQVNVIVLYLSNFNEQIDLILFRYLRVGDGSSIIVAVLHVNGLGK